MDGKTHFKLGLTSAVSTVIVASSITNNNSMLIYGIPIAMGASILTSQLPDIDSKKSKISKYIPIINWLKSKTMIFISFIILLLLCGDYVYANLLSYEIHKKMFFIAIAILVLHIFVKIFFKHRKLTHCILSCMLISYIGFLPFISTGNNYFFVFGLGISAGYISHIFYDCLTVKGCEPLYPILKIKIRGKWTSEKDANKALRLSFVIIFLSILYYFNVYNYLIELINKSAY